MRKVLAIYTAPTAGSPMEQQAEVRVEAGRGIVGDRYYVEQGTFSAKLKGKPHREITLIESEKIDYFNQQTGHKLSYGDPRRNIVTADVDLNDLVGVRFRVGEVLLEGVKLCEPCAYLADLLAKEVLPVLVNRGGLRAQILSTGTIKASDAVDTVA